MFISRCRGWLSNDISSLICITVFSNKLSECDFFVILIKKLKERSHKYVSEENRHLTVTVTTSTKAVTQPSDIQSRAAVRWWKIIGSDWKSCVHILALNFQGNKKSSSEFNEGHLRRKRFLEHELVLKSWHWIKYYNTVCKSQQQPGVCFQRA